VVGKPSLSAILLVGLAKTEVISAMPTTQELEQNTSRWSAFCLLVFQSGGKGPPRREESACLRCCRPEHSYLLLIASEQIPEYSHKSIVHANGRSVVFQVRAEEIDAALKQREVVFGQFVPI
jgi:hypothetical protein